MVKMYFKNKSQREKAMHELEAFRTNAWVYVEDPTTDELQALVDQFALDESLLHDAIDMHEVPRIEVEDTIIYIYTRFAFQDDDHVSTAPLMIALKKDCILTISPKKLPGLESLLSGKVEVTTVQGTMLVLRLFMLVNTTYNTYLNSMSKKLRSLSVRVEKIKNRDIIQFVNYENVLYDLNSALVRINRILTSLLGGKIITFTEPEMDIVEDLSLENVQLTQISQESLRSIVNIREAYSTIMTNNLNYIIKLFTSLTVILTIPTITGTLYGMNVRLPFAQSPMAFFGIVLLTLAAVLISVIIFMYKDWL